MPCVDFTHFSPQHFTRPYCDACSIKIVDDHWLGGQMSVCDFTSTYLGTMIGARLARRDVAMTLAACMVCAAASDGNAATPFVAPASPTRADEMSASFAERFNIPPASLMQDIFARLTYYAPVAPLTTASLPRHRKIVPAAPAIVGIASMYNPTDPNDLDAGNEETASGERYDANGWTAAIRTDLRAKFGGVRFGRNYRPGFALVQSRDKQLVVRINDVGPLKRGRIIDLNKRAMRYFDPTLQLGLIGKVRVTPLAGQDIALGPVGDDRPVSVASRFDR
jgi:rare lipoprotein A